MCPSCGTKLVKRKFFDALSEPENPEENLYCQKCGIRWIAEQYSSLNTEKAEKTEPNVPIEFEQVTIKVPKPIMEFLRKTDCDNIGPEAWIEETIVDSVRAYFDAVEAEELVDWFKLGPVFYEVLGDKNFKPTTTDQEAK